MSKCPVCLDTHSGPVQLIDTGSGFRVDCPVCGRFELSREAWEDYLDPLSGEGHKLSLLCRARMAHKIRTANSDTRSTPPYLDQDFVRIFIDDGCPGPTPAEQAVNAIRYIGDEISRSGELLKTLPDYFYALIGAPSPNFAGNLAIELKERGLLDGIDTTSMGSPPSMIDVNLTLSGWERYEAARRGQIASKYGFIAMEFGDAILDPFVKNVVKPAVMDGIGYELVDMRSVARAGIIDNIMRAQIRDAAFVLVDLTHDNSGAYWEAGYAEGLGKPVIYICERQKFDDAKTHFDTNHCTTVLWSKDDPDDFRQKLIATLRRSLNLF